MLSTAREVGCDAEPVVKQGQHMLTQEVVATQAVAVGKRQMAMTASSSSSWAGVATHNHDSAGHRVGQARPCSWHRAHEEVWHGPKPTHRGHDGCHGCDGQQRHFGHRCPQLLISFLLLLLLFLLQRTLLASLQLLLLLLLVRLLLILLCCVVTAMVAIFLQVQAMLLWLLDARGRVLALKLPAQRVRF